MKRKIFLILLFLVIIFTYKQSEEIIFIPDSSIRLRVIPNSNDSQDIYIKEKVKKYLESNVFDLTKNTTSIEEARFILKDNLKEIETDIDSIFKDNTYTLPFNINYGTNYFPEKNYKGITYKEGYYESLVISIGEASGDNFWCVLFPNFCLIDNEEPHTYKSYIKELINKIF